MRILVIGAGGYVGAGVARALMRAGHEVHALARDGERAARFEAQSHVPVVGDFGQPALSDAAAALDGVINCAAIPIKDEWAAVAPLLDRMAGSGKPFITTSGTAVLSIATPDGEWREETFAEDDPFEPPAWIAVRKETEDRVRAAAERGVRAMVVRPPMVWGRGGSGQIPAMRDSISTVGRPCYVGLGLNLYSHVHVDDLGELFRLALERGQAGALYHAVAGETSWRSIAEALGRAAARSPCSISLDEAKQLWGGFRARTYFGVSSRSRAVRARRDLGWAPLFQDVLRDVEFGSYRPQQ